MSESPAKDRPVENRESPDETSLLTEERFAAAARTVLKDLPREERVRMAAELRMDGVSLDQIEAVLGVSRTQHWRWRQEKLYQDIVNQLREEAYVDHVRRADRLLESLYEHMEHRLERGDQHMIDQLMRAASPLLFKMALTRPESASASSINMRVEDSGQSASVPVALNGSGGGGHPAYGVSN